MRRCSTGTLTVPGPGSACICHDRRLSLRVSLHVQCVYACRLDDVCGEGEGSGTCCAWRSDRTFLMSLSRSAPPGRCVVHRKQMCAKHLLETGKDAACRREAACWEPRYHESALPGLGQAGCRKSVRKCVPGAQLRRTGHKSASEPLQTLQTAQTMAHGMSATSNQQWVF